jgi:uncharacterized damage-inducible protein DinB
MDEKLQLLAQLEYCRSRTAGLLKTIEALPEPAKALSWRPGPGRAHIGWQLMHIAATDDGYLAKRILNAAPKQPEIVDKFGGGSTPTDAAPSAADIRRTLEENRTRLVEFVRGFDAAKLDQKPFADSPRTVRESLMLLAWHESHHQGQAHITLNLYKAAHGIK